MTSVNSLANSSKVLVGHESQLDHEHPANLYHLSRVCIGNKIKISPMMMDTFGKKQNGLGGLNFKLRLEKSAREPKR